jgi:hypothetical protein
VGSGSGRERLDRLGRRSAVAAAALVGAHCARTPNVGTGRRLSRVPGSTCWVWLIPIWLGPRRLDEDPCRPLHRPGVERPDSPAHVVDSTATDCAPSDAHQTESSLRRLHSVACPDHWVGPQHFNYNCG